MSYEKIAVEYEDSVAIVKLNDPGVLNALSNRMVQELHAAIAEVLASDARCLLLTGEGRAFCAGANLATGHALKRAEGAKAGVGGWNMGVDNNFHRRLLIRALQYARNAFAAGRFKEALQRMPRRLF